MTRDLIERLAAADPHANDDAPVDEALLRQLVATPVGERRRRRRPLIAGAVAAGVAVAAVFAVVNLAGGGDAVLDRAVAAVSRENSVYHVRLVRQWSGDVEGSLRRPFRIESWRASDGRLHQVVRDDRGRLLEETAGVSPPNGGAGPLLRYDPRRDRLVGEGIGGGQGDELALDPGADPAATLRALERQGLLEVAGETQVGDRPAYRLVSDAVNRYGDDPRGEERYEYVVDGETYLPLSLRWTMGSGSEQLAYVDEFEVYERLPVDARSEARLAMAPHPRASCAPGAAELELHFPNPCR
jgi:hypothetical protein